LAGASELILVARRKEKLEETATSISSLAPDCKTVIHGGVDVGDWTAINNLFQSLSSSPDVVVSNAAVNLSKADIAVSDPEVVSREIDTNVKGPYYIARAYGGAAEKAGKDGCLITVRMDLLPRKHMVLISLSGFKRIKLEVLSRHLHLCGNKSCNQHSR
jgi:NAD(P)-dependent dehydrogenase (short-subunit alcohol dehydrogenase family)